MNHKYVYGHEEDRVIDPCTFQPFCRRCRVMWDAITADQLVELAKRAKADEAYDRAMGGI